MRQLYAILFPVLLSGLSGCGGGAAEPPVVVVSLPSASEKPPAGVPGECVPVDGRYWLGRGICAANLTVWPVYTLSPALHLGDFQTIQQAYADGKFEIREREQGGTVNELLLVNNGELPVLVPQGTIVKGGKQDRQIALDLIVRPGASVPASAYCVEHGRWSTQREGAETKGVFEPEEVLASRRVRAGASTSGGQSEVWKQVAEVNRRAGAAPATGTLLAAVESVESSPQGLEKEMAEAVVRHFQGLPALDKLVGFAYAVNGEPMGMRTFAHPRLFELQFPPFLRTMCLEAELARRRDLAHGHRAADHPASAADLVAMVLAISAGETVERDTPSGGRVRQQRTARGVHSECLAELGYADGEAQTLTEDWVGAPDLPQEVRDEYGLQELGYSGQP